MSKVFLCVLVLLIFTVGLEGKPRKWRGEYPGYGRKGNKNSGGSSQGSEETDGLTFEDGEKAVLTCPSGSVIDITIAKYGKKKKECDPQAFEKVSQLCNKKEVCSFIVDDWVFDDSNCASSGSGSRNLKLMIEFECKDPCEGFCCANGGECKFDVTTLTPMGKCSESWTGPSCDDNPCAEITCENGGNCRVNPQDGSASCFCAEGFSGDDCSVDACSLFGCQNGAECVQPQGGQPQCICTPGFQGPKCEIDCATVQTCPAGFQELPVGSGKCFFICPSDSESWLSAEADCRAIWSTLWEPASSTGPEVAAVTGALENGEKYWTGGFDGVEEGSPVYVSSGSTVSLGPDTDDSNTSEKDCIEVFKGSVGKIFDWVFKYGTCTETTRRCICEKLGPCDVPQVSFPGFPVTRK